MSIIISIWQWELDHAPAMYLFIYGVVAVLFVGGFGQRSKSQYRSIKEYNDIRDTLRRTQKEG